AVAVLLRVERQREGLLVVELGQAEHVAHGVGDDTGCPGAVVDEPRALAAERLVEGLERGGVSEAARRACELDNLFGRERLLTDRLGEGRGEGAPLCDHWS